MNSEWEPLLAAFSPDAPSGSDLEYDPDFSRMEKAAQGKPDQEFGDTKIEGAPADWEEVQDAALSILRRSKDLRAATYLAEAELFCSGLVGFRDVLQIISEYTDKFWDTVYPQLDADDDNDPTIRINSLAGLCKVGGLIRQLRQTPILISRSVGKFSLTDCAIAKGELPVPAGMESPPTQKQIDAAVMACEPATFSELVQAVDESLQYAAAIENGFSDRLGPAIGPNLEPLRKELKAISRFQKAWVAMRKDLDQPQAQDETESIAAAPAPGQVATPSHVAAVPREFVISKREDVLEGLDKIIKWLEKNEPSSPLPMLLKRAKRLSTMSFLDILRDLSPEGVTQAEKIIGTGNELPEASAPVPTEAPSGAKASRPAKSNATPNDGY